MLALAAAVLNCFSWVRIKIEIVSYSLNSYIVSYNSLLLAPHYLQSKPTYPWDWHYMTCCPSRLHIFLQKPSLQTHAAREGFFFFFFRLLLLPFKVKIEGLWHIVVVQTVTQRAGKPPLLQEEEEWDVRWEIEGETGWGKSPPVTEWSTANETEISITHINNRCACVCVCMRACLHACGGQGRSF